MHMSSVYRYLAVINLRDGLWPTIGVISQSFQPIILQVGFRSLLWM